MKKLLITFAFLLCGLLSKSQEDLRANYLHYFSDVYGDNYTTSKVNIAFNLKIVNDMQYITVIDNAKQDTIVYLLTEKRDVLQPFNTYLIVSYFCKDPQRPDLAFLISIMFYKATKKVQSVGISDGVSLSIYDINNKTNSL